MENHIYLDSLDVDLESAMTLNVDSVSRMSTLGSIPLIRWSLLLRGILGVHRPGCYDDVHPLERW